MLQDELITIKRNVQDQQNQVVASLKNLFDGLGQKLTDIELDQAKWDMDIRRLKGQLDDLQNTNKSISKQEIQNCNNKIQEIEQHCEKNKQQQEVALSKLQKYNTQLLKQNEQSEQNEQIAKDKYEQNLVKLRLKTQQAQIALENCDNEKRENVQKLQSANSKIQNLETVNQNLTLRGQKLDLACAWLTPSLETLDLNWSLPVNTAINYMVSQLNDSKSAAKKDAFEQMHPLNFFVLYQMSTDSKNNDWKTEFDQRWTAKYKGDAKTKLGQYLEFYWEHSKIVESQMIPRILYRTLTLFLFKTLNQQLSDAELELKKLQSALYEPFAQVFVIPPLTNIVEEDKMFPYIRSATIGTNITSKEFEPLLCFFKYFSFD